MIEVSPCAVCRHYWHSEVGQCCRDSCSEFRDWQREHDAPEGERRETEGGK